MLRCRCPFLIFLALAGCTGEDQPLRQGGIVTLDGRPLAGATVTFLSTQNKRPATATTDDNGQFQLMTFQAGDGAFRGEYRVVVEMPDKNVWGNPGVKKDNGGVPHANYRNVRTTPLLRTVPAPEGTLKLELNVNGT